MKRVLTEVASTSGRHWILGVYLVLYMLAGIRTELGLLERKPLTEAWMQDYTYYERALEAALNGRAVYTDREIGTAFLYPPTALLSVEVFSHVRDEGIEGALIAVTNLALLVLITYGVARCFSHPVRSVWWWFVLALGFAPFLEVLHIGQINTLPLLGLFLMFVARDRLPALSGAGLALAVGTKLSPLLFLPYLAASRKSKVLVMAFAAMAAFAGLSVLRFGLGPWIEYAEAVGWLTSRFVLDHNSQSLAAKLVWLVNSKPVMAMILGLPAALGESLRLAARQLPAALPAFQLVLTVYVAALIALSSALTFFGRQPGEPLFILSAIAMVLAPNLVWYHHYIFMLLPLFVWMAWTRLEPRSVAWCLLGFMIIQSDRWLPPYGLLIHVFGHASMLILLVWQVRALLSRRAAEAPAPRS